jgi:hypothetical protein
MTALDYHIAEPKFKRTHENWIAKCKCGWQGADRTSKAAAEQDCLAHETAHNGDHSSRNTD